MSSNQLEKTDIKFYLTSIEPNMSQSIYSQSLGGYVSNSLLYPETSVSSTVGLYDSSISVDGPITSNDWVNSQYISVGREMMGVGSISGNVLNVTRATNNILNIHIPGDDVKGVSNQLFNNSINSEYKQYRCVAVKNINPWFSAFNVSTYVVQNSLNLQTSLQIAVEIPPFLYLSRNSTSWGNIFLTDSSLVGVYTDNYFKEGYLRILNGPNSGQNRLISSFDSTTGKFIFYNAVPVDYSSAYSSSVDYEIDPGPSQRISTGTVSPDTTISRCSSFSYASSSSNAVSMDVASTGVDSLSPNNLFYIWIERTLTKGDSAFVGNSIILTMEYNV
jgi:hypothetical protein